MSDSNKILRDKVNFSVKEKYTDGIPKSIIKPMKIKKFTNYVDDSAYLQLLHDNGVYKHAGGGYIKRQNIKLSQFNTGLLDFIIKKYLFPCQNENYDGNGRWILDPFMGRATRPLMLNHYGFNYKGYDVSKTIVGINNKMISEKILNDDPLYNKQRKIITHNSDGTTLENLTQNKYDSVITCPPYWNTEKYYDGNNQLSLMKLDEFKQSYKRLFESLRGKVKNYVIIVVGDVRNGKDGIFDFSCFNIQEALKNNFILWDKVIMENITPTLHILARRNEATGYVHKVHETILVFKERGN